MDKGTLGSMCKYGSKVIECSSRDIGVHGTHMLMKVSLTLLTRIYLFVVLRYEYTMLH